ncbi:hypothetical protein POL68_17040 [Stigmatella sp. ncwal1]|uniref:Uncharacterized protein n=1 Tax=Stigmatella ashevillensis TaxID=2995309 RepID=A0ABT5D938_9BACT|nr:hypothetical protein [Stigmatella ashevillena]MDC0710186.1 hypothetical protein [Stigmatella ashevillena]
MFPSTGIVSEEIEKAVERIGAMGTKLKGWRFRGHLRPQEPPQQQHER